VGKYLARDLTSGSWMRI